MEFVRYLTLFQFSDLFDLLHIPFQIFTQADSHSYIPEKPVVPLLHGLREHDGGVPKFDLENSVRQLRRTPAGLDWSYRRVVSVISDINAVYAIVIAMSVYDLFGK